MRKLFLESIFSDAALTPRELELIAMLVDGEAATRPVSQRLKISESTVRNHIDNISRKTGLGGKVEILSRVADELLTWLTRVAVVWRPPEAVVWDLPESLGEAVTSTLRQAGIQVRVADGVGWPAVHFVGWDWERSSEQKRGVVVAMTSRADLHRTTPEGADLVCALPVDARSLVSTFEAAASRLATAPSGLRRSFRADLPRPVIVGRTERLIATNLGEYGMFLKASDLRKFEIGKTFPFELDMGPSQPLSGDARVVWMRELSTPRSPSGIGVEFVKLKAADRKRLTEMIQTSALLALARRNFD
jgi:DNA-binding CsgD family transcriptional regulator